MEMFLHFRTKNHYQLAMHGEIILKVPTKTLAGTMPPIAGTIWNSSRSCRMPARSQPLRPREGPSFNSNCNDNGGWQGFAYYP
jgi:hypothetical protein